ncbi:hypothetical protein K227x_32910 [Rubripirellula lacrimiformis]|uniref:Uncharacterized protein n=1 Tax=Rubripirellula lacrimiformis TaxID=1930273 RepID=A0A517NCM9_9BACT|nr:DUF6653 family protein [Rubripirellula lacrimiformis]QDT04894.1 hypothetical protein K227x_32910 [Rubripirellula lacrimiformis]
MNRLGRLTEQAMGMNDTVWQRHVNPWSGWTRVVTLPLLAIAIWSRVWIGLWSLVPIAVLIVWIWINPRVFPRPKSVDNWMSQGVLGERIWLANEPGTVAGHHVRVARKLTMIAGLGTAIFLGGLIWLDLAATLFGLAVTMLGKLWFIDRMVWIYRDHQSVEG